MSGLSLALHGPISSSSACAHPFLDRLQRSARGSRVLRLFAQEYSVLRRGARALDAALPDSDEVYRHFQQTLGLIGPGWVTQSLSGTQQALTELQPLLRDPVLRDGSLWAVERVGLAWANRCAETQWGRGFWSERSQAEQLIPDPVDGHAESSSWLDGRDRALKQLVAFLDSMEQAVTDERVA